VERDAGLGAIVRVETVRIGASTLSGYEWLPDLLRAIEAAGLPLEVEVALDVSLNPVQALRERKIDVAIKPARVTLGSTRSIPLFRDEMVAVLPAGHSKCGRPYLAAEDLLDEPYIADGTTRETGREFERLFEPSGVRPQRVLRAGHTEAVIALVRAGFGLTILSRRTAQAYLDRGGLTAVPLTPKGLYLEWHAALRKDSYRSSPARTVADLLIASTSVDRRIAAPRRGPAYRRIIN
jgi:LysR family transcriptional regulator for metE and metH